MHDLKNPVPLKLLIHLYITIFSNFVLLSCGANMNQYIPDAELIIDERNFSCNTAEQEEGCQCRR